MALDDMTEDDDLRDHFERQYARGGPDADIARAVLDLFDRTIDVEEELEVLEDYTPAEAAKRLDEFDGVRVWAERDITFKDFGELDEDTLERFARAYDRYETESFALQELCVEAGLLDKNDFTSNPLPLIRMFLPI